MFERSRHGAVDVITVRDPLNADSAQEMGPVVDDVLGRGQPRLVIDLERVPLINSDGLEWLVELNERSRRRGGAVKLSSPTPLCRDILTITGLDVQFEIFPELIGAVRSFAQ